MKGALRRLTAGLCFVGALALGAPAAAQADAWQAVSGKLSPAGAEVQPERFRAYRLNESALRADLRGAAKGARAADSSSAILELPGPNGGIQRFRVHESPIMEPGLAARHPEIKTYAGRGLDDATATVRADLSPRGLRASVRSAAGGWYVDPYYRNDDSVYVSYFTRDAHSDAAEKIAQQEPIGEGVPVRSAAAAALGPEVQLRTYRLALITDPSYANYHGVENVTAAKVTLMNRVNHIYETESAIRMILVADNDKLNLNTTALATGANGPCGAAGCYTSTNSCGSVLARNRIVIGQIIGAGNYDIGHIAMGNSGGGVANLGVVGGNNKAGGCTGLATPIGDFFAVDYVAHEMGHQFNGNHTFNGTQRNCSGGNRNAANSVEPGSGSSIMAYAGICDQDNLQPHTDPYWSQRSFDEITSLVTGTRPPISEVQNVSLRDFDETDSVSLSFNGATVGPFVRGTSYTAFDIQGALAGQEVQAVQLGGYDADGDSYTLSFQGVDSHPIVRGQNNTSAGIANALAGGNEQQQVSLTGFNQNQQSFQIQIGDANSATLGQGGLTVSNANVAAAINAIAGFAGGATVTGAGNGGFTVTFAGASAGVDAPAISIVNCTGACTSAVRELAKGGPALSSWPAGATVTVGTVVDTGYNLLFGGALAGQDVDPLSVTNASGATGAVAETTKGTAGVLGAGGTAAVAGFGGGAFNDTGFQVTFGGALANVDQPALGLEVVGGSGFVGETARGGPIQNNGFTVAATGNHAPDVTAPASFVIPPRTPFALTGTATDDDNDVLTYMWEQNDRGGISGGSTAGTALVNNVKTNGPLFRQFGKAADVSATDTLLYNSPGLNAVTTDPTRVFPDMDQILAGNTNAATGACPAAPPAPQALPATVRECYSEFLPTTDWVGFLGDRTMNFRLTARDSDPAGGGVGFASTKVTIAPFAGPFQVTSHTAREVIYGTTQQTVTWDVAGTDVSPIDVTDVKISISTDGGATWPHVLAESTPNDGSHVVTFPSVNAAQARIKVEAVGNVFFDVSDADLALVDPPTLPVGATVPATLSLTLGAPASFGAFTPGVDQDYEATSSANVISTAGDAALSVTDPSATAPGHLVNGSFVMPSALQARAGTAGAFSTVGSAPATLKTYDGPVSNDAVALAFRQHVEDTDALRTGVYSKTLTFTLSTTQP